MEGSALILPEFGSVSVRLGVPLPLREHTNIIILAH